MATFLSKFTTSQLATANSPRAGVPVVNDYFVDATIAQLVAGTVFDIGVLPAGHTVTDAMLISGDIDSNATPLVTLDVGIMSGTPGDAVSARTCGAEIFAADVGARTGAMSRMTLASGALIKASGEDRSIGVKVVAAPATAAAGRIRLRVTMHQSDSATQF